MCHSIWYMLYTLLLGVYLHCCVISASTPGSHTWKCPHYTNLHCNGTLPGVAALDTSIVHVTHSLTTPNNRPGRGRGHPPISSLYLRQYTCLNTNGSVYLNSSGNLARLLPSAPGDFRWTAWRPFSIHTSLPCQHPPGTADESAANPYQYFRRRFAGHLPPGREPVSSHCRGVGHRGQVLPPGSAVIASHMIASRSSDPRVKWR